jgi:hypothetical protein
MNTQLLQETCAADSSRPRPPDDREPLTALPVDKKVDETLVEMNEHSALGLVELILKSPARLDALMNHDARKQPILIPRFLGIALASYVLYAIAMIVILNAASPEAYPHNLLPVPAASYKGSALGLLLGYNVGLVAATCICLPSFYFFALLAGVRLTMLQIVGQVMRCKANSALVLLGILPIYVAFVLGLLVFQAPAATLEWWLYLGLMLPFVAGLQGMLAIYRGVMGMADTMPPDKRCRRECFLRRLTVSWAACYTAVSPVMIYRLWEFLAGQLG